MILTSLTMEVYWWPAHDECEFFALLSKSCRGRGRSDFFLLSLQTINNTVLTEELNNITIK